MNLIEEIKKRYYDGTLIDAYNYMGCQYNDTDSSAVFRVYAPNAKRVALVGEFNNWDSNASVMENDGGFWLFNQKKVKLNQGYKYAITMKDGQTVNKSDPYAFHSETRGETASKISSLKGLKVKPFKSSGNAFDGPMNIYEAHIGSWRKYQDGNNFNYRKFADEICVYLLEMNYTHLELMGIAEYPFDGSWGYQVTGYYAPTSRYGGLEDFCYLINKLHENGIAIIMDWVPGHFPKDESGLIMFDGTPLYEPYDKLMREHKEWGTMCFNYSSGAVRTFLISNAMYYFDIFKIDGLRVDAVASMLYLDYGRKKWRKNEYGGNENLSAISFFKQLNTAVFSKFENALMIAEESTAFPLVTKPVHDGGLGFNFKWNMGWMNDTLKYLGTDPLYRGGSHGNMTFSLTYAYSENFILPISHDEVVYGKGSLLNKSPLLYEDKFANMRVYLLYMYSHPGKKLLFMGSEFAQFDEWNFKKELDWGVLQYDTHRNMKEFVKTLNGIYKEYSPLYELESDWMGFEWLIVDDYTQNVFAYERRNKVGDKIIVVLNFSPMTYDSYQVGVEKGKYTELICTDNNGYKTTNKTYTSKKSISNKKGNSITLNLQSYAGIYLHFNASNNGRGKT